MPFGPTTTTIPGLPAGLVDRPPADAGIYGAPADGIVYGFHGDPEVGAFPIVSASVYSNPGLTGLGPENG